MELVPAEVEWTEQTDAFVELAAHDGVPEAVAELARRRRADEDTGGPAPTLPA